MAYLSNNVLTIKDCSTHAFVCNGPTAAGWYGENLVRCAEKMNLLDKFRKHDKDAMETVCNEFAKQWAGIVTHVTRNEAKNAENVFTSAVLDLDTGVMNYYWEYNARHMGRGKVEF